MAADELDPEVQDGQRFETFEGSCEVEIGDVVPHRRVTYHYGPDHARGPGEETALISSHTVHQNVQEGVWQRVEHEDTEEPEPAVEDDEDQEDDQPATDENGDEAPEHECQECGATFGSAQALAGHAGAHSG